MCESVAQMIHPTAIISPQAKLGANVSVGPYAIIDGGVELGADCVVGPQVYLTGETRIGAGNKFHAGCVIGDAPQDLKYRGQPTRLRIGDHNVFREHVTVHRSTKPESETVIGANNFIMAHAHVAHNCFIGNQVIIANGALLGGHVEVQDRAFISGNCCVHQFVRVGTLAMMQGGSAVSVDLAPFSVVQQVNEMVGLNTVGLRRAGLSAAERQELKQLYRFLFRSGKNLRSALAEAAGRFTQPPSRTMLDFVRSAKRGVCADAGRKFEKADEERNEL